MTSQSSAGVTTSSYDGSGNFSTSLAPGNQPTTNTWDGESRLIQVALPSGIVDSFTYNGDGQRVQRQDSTGTTNHVWDRQNILLETNASNIIQVVYTLEPLLYGNLVSQRRSGTESFYAFDALGSSRELTCSAGSVTDSYLYDGWGNTIAVSGLTTNWLRFAGRYGYYLDSDLGAYYVRAREYGAQRGAWYTRDPVFLQDPMRNAADSGYAYARNNPLRYRDASGLQVPMPVSGPPKRWRPAPPTSPGTKWDYYGWGYGWFCGLLRTGPPSWLPKVNPPYGPIDQLDKACRAHDKCLATCWDFFDPLKQYSCDKALCKNALYMLAFGCNQDYPVEYDWLWDSYSDCEQAAFDVGLLYCTLTGYSGPWVIPTPTPMPY